MSIIYAEWLRTTKGESPQDTCLCDEGRYMECPHVIAEIADFTPPTSREPSITDLERIHVAVGLSVPQVDRLFRLYFDLERELDDVCDEVDRVRIAALDAAAHLTNAATARAR